MTEDADHDLELAHKGLRCPFCGEERQIEKVAGVWLCLTCSKQWTIIPPKE
jgi:ribosomal protein L37AE/L43A